MTEEQKQEFLQSIWNLVSTFVQMGFGVESTQTACGKDTESAVNPTLTTKNTVKYNHGRQPIKDFVMATDSESNQKGEPLC